MLKLPACPTGPRVPSIGALLLASVLSACAPSNQADGGTPEGDSGAQGAGDRHAGKAQPGADRAAGHVGPAEAAGACGGPWRHGRAEPTRRLPKLLTVAELLTSKDRYLGTRVKVKGMPGPVMVHHKSLMLKGPQGMVEVLFGNLPDPKLVQSLTSTTLDKPLTVTGVVNLPPARGAGAQLQINAEAVEF